ncbi:Pirin-related protein [Spongiibacter sp. IMCC21906]|uniref:pirin family protein n=1 Tax=Spongiibacter sp. IMCC21906 TaxID=1620392 RepID=UPI00062E004C|nr:pirin family protein [Spongiibacter sp. IMCC21906]AKH68762.1 Pirin-related protein [Spongiibacter sp. IMCC21906]
MSNVADQLEQGCVGETSCAAVSMLLIPKEKDLGGFSVRRVLPSIDKRMIGPWVFFDHMGPAEFAAGEGINVRPHPHIGIATVTYLFEGEILHRDSVGSLQAIRPGDINLMVAGSGIVHSERERPEITAVDHRLHGLQLWLALPEGKEEIPAAFYHYPGADLPALHVHGVPVRVMMGRAYGVDSPVTTFSDTLYVEAHMQPGQKLQLPEADELGLYVASGELKARDTSLPQYSMAVFDNSVGVEVEAVSESRIAMIGGRPLAPRFMEWNFVSSRKARIEKAKSDWTAGRFTKVLGDEEAFIPLP